MADDPKSILIAKLKPHLDKAEAQAKTAINTAAAATIAKTGVPKSDLAAYITHLQKQFEAAEKVEIEQIKAAIAKIAAAAKSAKH